MCVKNIKRFLIYGSEVIQGISELWPGNKEERHTVKLFSDFLLRGILVLRVLAILLAFEIFVIRTWLTWHNILNLRWD